MSKAINELMNEGLGCAWKEVYTLTTTVFTPRLARIAIRNERWECIRVIMFAIDPDVRFGEYLTAVELKTFADYFKIVFSSCDLDCAIFENRMGLVNLFLELGLKSSLE